MLNKSGGPIRVAITGVGGDVGLAALKGIREEHHSAWILAMDSVPCCAGFAMADASVVAPYVADTGYVVFLIDMLKQFRIQLLIPGIDSEIPLLARERERIERESGCQVLVAVPEFVNRSADKVKTAHWLKELRLPAPATWDVDDEDAKTLRSLPLPLVAKPRKANASKGIKLLYDQEDLDTFLAENIPGYCLQELIEGDEYTCGLLFDKHGALCDWIYMCRDLSGGRTIRARTATVKAIDELVERFGEQVMGYGPANLQLRLDAAGIPYIFEINPRLSGSSAMRIAVGYNDPARIVSHWLMDQDIKRAVVREATVYDHTTQFVVQRQQVIGKRRRPKSLVFDCGDTLLELEPARELICRDVLHSLGFPTQLGEIRKAYQLVEFSVRQNASQLSNQAAKVAFYNQFNARLALALGVESKTNEFNVTLQKAFSLKRHWVASPSTVFFLEQLKGNYDCFVLANWDGNLEDVLEHAGIRKFFKGVYASTALGAEKPDPVLFERFVEESSVSPAGAFYIGNEYTADVVGSRNAGFTPVLVDRYGTLPSHLDCYRICSWLELGWLHPDDAMKPVHNS